MASTVLPSVKGQITIPVELREKYKISKNTPLVIEDKGKGELSVKIMQMVATEPILRKDDLENFSALANDLSYEDVFIQQLRNLINSKDLLIVISGSGNSPNIIKALEYARRRKAVTIGLLGFKTGGKAARLTDVPLSVNNTKYGPCEDVHLILAHIITSLLALQKEHHD